MEDVIVVGAGPGGCVAAALLARAGIGVEILDRQEHPRPKACGDAVPPPGMDILRALGVDLDALPRWDVHHIVARSPSRRCLHLPHMPGFQGSLVRRDALDAALFDCALRAGARFAREDVTGALLDGGRAVGVRTREGARRARAVIAADGATSAVARSLGAPRADERMRGVAVRAYVDTPGYTSREIELDFFDDLQPAYGWFFPAGPEVANVGVFLRARSVTGGRPSLRARLDAYLREPHVAARARGSAPRDVSAWQLPLFDPAPSRAYDGALLVGDAGGFVNPLTGAGIQQAMVTGRAAAEALSAALRAGDLSRAGLARYDVLWRAALTREMRASSLARDALDRWPRAMDLALPAIAPFRRLQALGQEVVFGR